jgi:hypothetical protein
MLHSKTGRLVLTIGCGLPDCAQQRQSPEQHILYHTELLACLKRHHRRYNELEGSRQGT